MRVAIVSPYAWDRHGGVQSHIRSLGAVLRQRGHEVEVWAPAVGELTPGEGLRIMGRAIGIPANGSVAPLSFGPGGARGIRRAMRELRPQLLHLHEPLVPSLSLQALLLTKTPSVATFHAAAESSSAYRLAAPILKKIAGRLKRRIAVSAMARDFVSRYIPGTYDLIPNGIDVARFAVRRRRDPRTVLFVGRLEQRKGVEVLLRAAPSVPGMRLVVAGEGPGERAARALAEDLEVRVEWLGRLDDDRLPEALASATIACAPNLGRESFGIILLEAMAAGTPVVCSDIPAFVEVAGGAAAHFAAGDPAALGRALRILLDDPGERRRLAAAGRRRAAGFDWSRLAGTIEALYEEALAPS